MDIQGYLNNIRHLAQSGRATEHSYRPALAGLFKSIDENLTVINEPKQSAVGAPDFVFERNGVSIGSPSSRLVVDYQGVYNVQFSAQLDKTSGGTGNIYIWLRKNGTNVANTASTVAIQGSAARTVAAWNFIIQLEPTHYVELMWATDDTSVRILAASATSVWPAIPSVICTITQVNNL
jgi:hypothetical protein